MHACMCVPGHRGVMRQKTRPEEPRTWCEQEGMNGGCGQVGVMVGVMMVRGGSQECTGGGRGAICP